MSLLAMALGYLLGSIPFSYLIARLAGGTDIRRVGTRNVGAHNVMREVGRLPGVAALLLDAGKGVAAVVLARELGAGEWAVVMAGVVAVVGHILPVWLGFRGGGGLATSLGIVLALLPLEGGISLACFLVLYLAITHNVAFSAGIMFLLTSILAWAWGRALPLVVAPLLLVGLMLFHQLPEVIALWQGAKDKWALVRDKFIFDKDAKF